jgi:ABC-type lipoprotein export system ATPase subunit
MSVVRARGLTKTFGEAGRRDACSTGPDFDVDAGELVAIVGRSGTGQVDAPAPRRRAGPRRRRLDRAGRRARRPRGRPQAHRAAGALGRLRLSVLPPRPELTGEENVLLPTRVNGTRRTACGAGRTCIDRLGLREVAGSLPHELSGGEQQRFAIARAPGQRPAVVLADEPIGNLDPTSGAVVLALLRAMADEGRAVAMVTHQPEASAIADRVLRVEDGRLA